jgi:hypothetical protein
MKTTEEREVMPQFGGIGKNLGTYTINPVVFTPEALREAVSEAIVERGICHLLNSQAHINFSGTTVYKAVRAKLEEKYGKPETKGAKEWHERHHAEAVRMASEMVPTMEFDYVEKVKEWARTDFANRGTSKNRPVLKEYDAVERFIDTRWAAAKAEAKGMCISQCKLEGVTVESSAVEVKAQLAKQYQRPVALDLGFLSEGE